MEDNFIEYKSNNNSLIFFNKIYNNKVIYKNRIFYLNKIYEKNKVKPNNVKLDINFYCKANNLNNDEDIYNHFDSIGIITGLIYHPQQLHNHFPDIKILEDEKKDIYVCQNNENIKLDVFVKKNLYDKDYEYYINDIEEKIR